jgi:hypothetical protein
VTAPLECRRNGVSSGIALGLILALAVDVDLSGLDLQTIGWILTLVGVGGLVLTLFLWNRGRGSLREEAVVRERPVVRETRWSGRPPWSARSG